VAGNVASVRRQTSSPAAPINQKYPSKAEINGTASTGVSRIPIRTIDEVAVHNFTPRLKPFRIVLRHHDVHRTTTTRPDILGTTLIKVTPFQADNRTIP
jgi:hypothetical protein